MKSKEVFEKFNEDKVNALDWFKEEISTLRTGRVTPDLIESVQIEHYGAQTPLNGLASISNADARTLVITPWDDTALQAIERELALTQKGAQPVVDGKVIRLSFPMLNEEMREETVKTLHRKAEETRVKLRQSRDELLNKIKKAKESSDLSEDDFYQDKKELDKKIDEANKEIIQITDSKEEEIKTL